MLISSEKVLHSSGYKHMKESEARTIFQIRFNSKILTKYPRINNRGYPFCTFNITNIYFGNPV